MRTLATLAAFVLLAACDGSKSSSTSSLSGASGPIATAIQGPPGPPGPRGVQGPQGPQGVAGAPAVVDTVSIAGLVEDVPGDAARELTFVGPTTTVGLADGQRLTASGTIALGTHRAVGTEVSLSFCLASGGGSPRTLVPDVFTNVVVMKPRHLFPVVGTAVPGAGTYTFGFCLKRVPCAQHWKDGDRDAWQGTTGDDGCAGVADHRDEDRGVALDDNDYAIAWVQIFR